MPKIEITARIEVTFKHTITKAQLARLKAGEPLEEVVDESVPYQVAATEGRTEMDWEPIGKLKTP
jgi:hypothetical protein